jgi:hypothetical protein
MCLEGQRLILSPFVTLSAKCVLIMEGLNAATNLHNEYLRSFQYICRKTSMIFTVGITEFLDSVHRPVF